MSTGRIFDPKFNERESTKSSVDDLILGRGDVSFRAAFTLRVTESQPHLTWRFEQDLFAHFPQSAHLMNLFVLKMRIASDGLCELSPRIILLFHENGFNFQFAR